MKDTLLLKPIGLKGCVSTLMTDIEGRFALSRRESMLLTSQGHGRLAIMTDSNSVITACYSLLQNNE